MFLNYQEIQKKSGKYDIKMPKSSSFKQKNSRYNRKILIETSTEYEHFVAVSKNN